MNTRAVIQSYTKQNRMQAIFITKKRNAAFRRHTDDMRKASLIMITMMQLCTVNESQASYPHDVEMECITSHKRAADMRDAGFCENESCYTKQIRM